MRQRLAAIVAIVAGAATATAATAVAVSAFPRGLGLLGCVGLVGAAGWYGLLRRGIFRAAGLAVAALGLAAAGAFSSPGGRCWPSCWSSPGSWSLWRRRVSPSQCT